MADLNVMTHLEGAYLRKTDFVQILVSDSEWGKLYNIIVSCHADTSRTSLLAHT